MAHPSRETGKRTLKIYPNGATITRAVQVGGLTTAELLDQLRCNAISLNESADRLFASDHFTTTATRYSVMTVSGHSPGHLHLEPARDIPGAAALPGRPRQLSGGALRLRRCERRSGSQRLVSAVY